MHGLTDTDTDEAERNEIWKIFTNAVRPLEDPQMRVALALAVLSALMDDEMVPTPAVVDAIERAESDIFARMYPPAGGAA